MDDKELIDMGRGESHIKTNGNESPKWVGLLQGIPRFGSRVLSPIFNENICSYGSVFHFFPKSFEKLVCFCGRLQEMGTYF